MKIDLTDPIFLSDPLKLLSACNDHINECKYREVIQISTVCGRPAIWYVPAQICVVKDTLSEAVIEFARELFEKMPKTSLDR